MEKEKYTLHDNKRYKKPISWKSKSLDIQTPDEKVVGPQKYTYKTPEDIWMVLDV